MIGAALLFAGIVSALCAVAALGLLFAMQDAERDACVVNLCDEGER